LRKLVNPGLKRRVVGENQVSQRARIVQNAVEAGDKGHLFERLPDLRLRGHSKDRIGSVEKQDLGRVRLVEENLSDEGFDRGEATRGLGRGGRKVGCQGGVGSELKYVGLPRRRER